MKTHICIISFLLLFVTSCDKIIPDLPRDNPLDTTGSTNTNDKRLIFYSYKVTCKYESGSVTYSEENAVKPGDRIYLWLNVKNIGGANLSGVRATITSSSDLVQLTELPSGEYIKLTEGSETNDYINSSSIGYATITDGQYYMSAPNYSAYGVEFKVSNTAVSGNQIPFTISMHDNSGGSWTETFNVVVN